MGSIHDSLNGKLIPTVSERTLIVVEIFQGKMVFVSIVHFVEEIHEVIHAVFWILVKDSSTQPVATNTDICIITKESVTEYLCNYVLTCMYKFWSYGILYMTTKSFPVFPMVQAMVPTQPVAVCPSFLPCM